MKFLIEPTSELEGNNLFVFCTPLQGEKENDSN
jgi:hypothetical protein